MYSYLHRLLSDKKGGEIFKLFDVWHFTYIGLTVLAMIVVLILLKNRSRFAKHRTAKAFIDIAFGLYILDFFLMPLAYNEIDIEKLPFHACTAMCVLCYFSHRIRCLEKFRSSFALLGFISNLVYLIYPAGVMWHGVHPLSYRVIQTLAFHSIMSIHCFLSLVYDEPKRCVRTVGKDLITVLGMTVWALIGNYTYNGTSEGYSNFFNWFFVVQDPFYILPSEIAQFMMPIVNIILFFAVGTLVRLLMGVIATSLNEAEKNMVN